MKFYGLVVAYLKTTSALLFCFIFGHCFAQAPFLKDGVGQGIGQYGYVDRDVSSIAVINTNTYENIIESRVRYWSNGISNTYYQYEPTVPGCFGTISSGTTELRCLDYVPADWGAAWETGQLLYPSVHLRYYAAASCTGGAGSWSHAVNATGFNERQIRIIDVQNVTTGLSPSINNSGSINLVQSFIIYPGVSGTSLLRLFVYNAAIGTAAQETEDILYDGVRLYYESFTGTEIYNGTENFQTLYGDWGGDVTTNEIWGNATMNSGLGISVPSAGLRCYIILSGLSTSFTTGRTALFKTLNDGMSMLPLLDDHGLVRLAEEGTTSIVLPIELLSFTATPINSYIEVNWATAHETNSDYFQLEHSTDAHDWQVIQKVNGAGTTIYEKEYQVNDYSAKFGSNYYRLKQLDLDGEFTYSPTVSASLVGSAALIYPNPVFDALYISNFSGFVRIISTSGQVCIFTEMSKDFIDVSHLPKGYYTLQLISPREQITKSFVKN